MRVESRKIRPIPRRAAQGWMCMGIIEDEGKQYVLELEPGTIIDQVNRPPVVHIVEYILMKRSSDLLDGDTEMIVSEEEWMAVLNFAKQEELITTKRVEGTIRKAAATGLVPPTYTHQYECLMIEYKLKEWEMVGRVGQSPKAQVTTHDCWKCPKKYRIPCISKLAHMYEQKDNKEFTKGELGGFSEEEKETKA